MINNRRYKLLKSNRPRIVFRLSNRSCMIQKIKEGFCPRGDIVVDTYLFHKTLVKKSCNCSNIRVFLTQVFKKITLRNTILDLGTRHKKGEKLKTVIDVYNKHMQLLKT